MNDDIKITCTNIDCPERHGGECTAGQHSPVLDTDIAVECFLSESNAIEGIYDDDSLRQAKYAWDYLLSQDKLDGGVILKTHKILMLHQPLHPNERGYWRTQGVYIGGREGANWHIVPELIAQWLDSVKALIAFSHSKQYHEVEINRMQIMDERIKNAHVAYEKIHPFIDGNGRTGRMFMNWTRLKVGLPLLVIFDMDKQSYYQWFKEA